MCRPVLSVTLTRSIYGLVKGEIFHAWPLRRLFVPTLVVVDLSSSFSWLLLSKIPCINICFNPLKRSMRRIGLSCLFQRLYRFTTEEELIIQWFIRETFYQHWIFNLNQRWWTTRIEEPFSQKKGKLVSASKLDTDHSISLDHSSRTILFSLRRSMSEKEEEEEEKRVEQSNDINVSIDPSHFNTCIPRSELGTANTVASTRLLCPLAITRSLLAPMDRPWNVT